MAKVPKGRFVEVQESIGCSFVNCAQIYSPGSPRTSIGLEHFVAVSLLKVRVL